MGDINFLSDKKGDDNKNRQKKEKRAIEWTKPVKDKEAADIKFMPEKRKNFADFLNLFKGGRELKIKKEKEFSAEKDVELKRKEVLDFIKKSEKPLLKEEEKRKAPDFNKPSIFSRGIQFHAHKKDFFKKHSPSRQIAGHSEKAPDKIISEKKKQLFKIIFWSKFVGRWRVYLEKRKKIKEERERIKKEKEKAERKIIPTVKPAEKEIMLEEKKSGRYIPAPLKPAPVAHKSEENKEKKPKEIVKEKIENITAGILGTNLIEGEMSAYFNWQKNAIIFSLGLIFACLLIGFSYAGVIYWEKKEKANIKSDKIEEINKEITRLESFAEKIKTIKEKSRLVEELLDKHIYWTNFFDFLEENTLKEIYYTSGFSGGTDGAYSLSAKAPDFQVIYNQVNILKKNKDVISAEVDSGSLSAPANDTEEEKDKEAAAEEEPEASAVDFNLNLKINPDIFMKK